MALRHDQSFEDAFDGLFAVAERVARRVAGPSDAEDVAAEVMGRTFARWSRLKSLPYLEAWVARVAFNEALDVFKRNRRSMSAAVGSSVDHDGTDEVAVRLALNEALAKLPKRQREVVALRYLADLSEADTATTLGLTVGSVKQHCRRALEAMRERLGSDPAFELEG